MHNHNSPVAQRVSVNPGNPAPRHIPPSVLTVNLNLAFEGESRFATLMIRVMKITALMMIVNLIQFIVEFLSGSLDAVMNLIVPLSVVYCGYVGAKQRNKPLLCCFCGCSLALGILGLMVVIALIVSFFSLGNYTSCHRGMGIDPQGSEPKPICVCVDTHNNTKELPYLASDQFEEDCDLGQAKSSLYIYFVFMLIMVVLDFCAFYFGKALHDQPYFSVESDIEQHMAIGMHVIYPAPLRPSPLLPTHVCVFMYVACRHTWACTRNLLSRNSL
jgi:hypothetical protein